MPATAQTILFFTLLCICASALSTTVQRCEDSAGRLTFTYQGCPSGSSMHFQKAYNAAPGSRVQLLPEAEPHRDKRTTSSDSRWAVKELVVVGQADDGCGNVLSSEERRRAIINQRTVSGMSQRDVESALGKPDKIASRNGETRYTYDEKNGRSHQVVFNEDGCVKAKR
jgi:hypothetical protein